MKDEQFGGQHRMGSWILTLVSLFMPLWMFYKCSVQN